MRELFVKYLVLTIIIVFTISERANCQNNIEENKVRSNVISLDEKIRVGKQALDLAMSTEDDKIIGSSYKSLSLSYMYKGILDSALYYNQKALDYLTICKDSMLIPKTLSNRGIMFRRKGRYDNALEVYLQALSYYRKLNNSRGIAIISLNIGGVYQKQQNYELAQKCYFKARKYFKENEMLNYLAKSDINIGVIYNIYGKHQLALEYCEKSYKILCGTNNMLDAAIALLNIGKAYEGMGKHRRALEYYTQTEKLRLELNDIWGLAKLYSYKANVLVYLNKYQLAEKYFIKSFDLNKKNQYDENLKDAYFYYSNFQEKINNFPKALSYYKKYSKLNDSLSLAIQNERMERMKAQYETEQKAKEFVVLEQKTKIQNLKIGKQNAWIAVLVVVLLLGFVAVIVSLRINRLRADHKILDLRQRVLLTQMNPHFLFNSLTAIQSFILDEKNNEANNYLARLASLVRGILENSREEFVSLRTELETLEEYIGMQKLRFDNDIEYEFNIDSTLDVNRVMVPPMLAQPFVENALIHGRLRNNPDAKIDIKVFLNDSADGIQFQIIDNGIGLEESKKNKSAKGHKSLATSIALDRVKIYNFKSARKMHFEIIDRKNIEKYLHGTQVSYSIPLLIN